MSVCAPARRRGGAVAAAVSTLALLLIAVVAVVAVAAADPAPAAAAAAVAVCAAPALSAHATATPSASSFPVGATVTVACERGFRLVRSSRASATPADLDRAAGRSAPTALSASCLSGGEGAAPTWSIPPQTLQCVPARCPNIELADPNLTVNKNRGRHGSRRRFACAAGYTMDGVADVHCDAGRWLPSAQPTCFQNQCDKWETPANGRAWLASNATEAGATRRLHFACDVGFKLAGLPQAVCKANHRWSSPAPRCASFGVRAYAGRAATFSAGALSVDNAFVLEGVLESARATPDCIGVTITRANGAVSAVLLHADESFLERRAGSDTYLLGKGGKAELHRGFAPVKRALLGPVEFATDAHVLTGVRNAVRKLRATQPDVIGFSVATGPNFHVQLLQWSGLPMRKDAGFNSFVLSSVERRVREEACVQGDKNGNGPLRHSQLLPNVPAKSKASRLACAAAARLAGHRYFALSHGRCSSGNQDFSSHAVAATGSCGGRFALPGGPTRPGGVEGAFHLFSLDSKLLTTGVHAAQALVRNGAFGGNFTFPAGRNHVSLTSKAGRELPGWAVSGKVGVARAGSKYANADREQPVPEGATFLYMEHGAEARQQLTGLVAGRRYRLSFSESFRTPKAGKTSESYVPGAGLAVTVGGRLVYTNPRVHVPLWEGRAATFRAKSSTAELRFAVDASEALHHGPEGRLLFAAVLLDGVRVEPVALRARRARSPAQAGRGVLRAVSSKHPLVLAALAESAARLPAVVGFSIKRGEVRLLSGAHVGVGAVLLPDSHSAIHLSNGTVLRGYRTALSAGHLSFREAAPLHRALRSMAKGIANSIGYTIGSGRRFRASILSAQALPFAPDAGSDSYVFSDAHKAMGCWALPAAGASLLASRHQLVGGVNRHACALAASRAGHRFYALQNKQCVSGSDDQSFRLGGPSSQCDLRCHNRRDVCGGEAAGMVYQLPRYTRVSSGGMAEALPALSDEEAQRARAVFSKPATVDFSSAAAPALSKADAAKLAAEPALPDGSKVEFRHELLYGFPGSQRHVVSLYRLRAPLAASLLPLAPRSWTLEGSLDGRSWTVLDAQVGREWRKAAQVRTFRLHNRAPFHFHRVVVTQNNAQSPGFALSGVELRAEAARAVSLVARWSFEDAAAVGFDSSARANDLVVLGAAGRAAVLKQKGQAAVGEGFLSLRGSLSEKAQATYLAVDAEHAAPEGLPAGADSFSVAFWFFVNSTDVSEDSSPMGVVSWGANTGAAASSVQLSASMQSVVATFDVAGSDPAVGLATPVTGGRLTDAWRHVAVTFDGASGVQTIYLDGTEAAARVVSDPALRVSASNFKLGASHLSGALRDQFRGRLDDVAIFRGALSAAQVKDVVQGDFRLHAPLDCQSLSDRFGIASQESWGRAPDSAKRQFIRSKCATAPADCATLSDVFGLSPTSLTSSDWYMSAAFTRLRCATWPSFSVTEGRTARCTGKQTLLQGVLSQEDARRLCMEQLRPACKAFVWSASARDETDPAGTTVSLAANTLSMCDSALVDAAPLAGAQTAQRLRPYYIEPDTSNRCDEEAGQILANIRTSQAARVACDQTEGCTGYVWTGPVGQGRNASAAPTPNMAMLCRGYRRHHPVDVAGSGYETGAVIRDYAVQPNRYGRCSSVSEIAVRYDVQSSLEARRHCDKFDGRRGARCISYVWNMKAGEAHLCSGVPQEELQVLEGVETAWLRPQSCEEISNRWGVAANSTWGRAPPSVRRLYLGLQCSSSPSSCQQLSDFYGLSPQLSLDSAARVPGSIRDLWLSQQCTTSPVGVALDRSKPQYLKIATGVESIEAQLARIDTILSRAELQGAAKASPEQREEMQRQVADARKKLEQTIQQAQA